MTRSQPTNRGGQICSHFSFNWKKDVTGGCSLNGCRMMRDLIVKIPSLGRRKDIAVMRREGGDDALQECVGLRKISLV